MKKLNKYTNMITNMLVEDIDDIVIGIPDTQIPPRILYDPETKTEGEIIDGLATKIGRLENKAIREMIETHKLCNVMRDHLSAKDIDDYFRSKAILTQLLKKAVSNL